MDLVQHHKRSFTIWGNLKDSLTSNLLTALKMTDLARQEAYFYLIDVEDRFNYFQDKERIIGLPALFFNGIYLYDTHEFFRDIQPGTIGQIPEFHNYLNKQLQLIEGVDTYTLFKKQLSELYEKGVEDLQKGKNSTVDYIPLIYFQLISSALQCFSNDFIPSDIHNVAKTITNRLFLPSLDKVINSDETIKEEDENRLEKALTKLQLIFSDFQTWGYWGEMWNVSSDTATEGLITVTDSPFTLPIKERRTTCHILAGIFEALLQKLIGNSVEVVEINCQTQGYSRCTFRVKINEGKKETYTEKKSTIPIPIEIQVTKWMKEVVVDYTGTIFSDSEYLNEPSLLIHPVIVYSFLRELCLIDTIYQDLLYIIGFELGKVFNEIYSDNNTAQIKPQDEELGFTLTEYSRILQGIVTHPVFDKIKWKASIKIREKENVIFFTSSECIGDQIPYGDPSDQSVAAPSFCIFLFGFVHGIISPILKSSAEVDCLRKEGELCNECRFKFKLR